MVRAGGDKQNRKRRRAGRLAAGPFRRVSSRRSCLPGLQLALLGPEARPMRPRSPTAVNAPAEDKNKPGSEEHAPDRRRLWRHLS